MPKLSKEYIDNHLHHVHDSNSFARSLAFNVLNSAGKQIVGEQDEITIPLTARVMPIDQLGCIQICVDTPFGPICYHVDV